MTRFRAKQVTVEPGAQGQSRRWRRAQPALTLLLAVTGFVLLIACANIANLLLARGAARASDMAVRLSIGASRWQVVRQLLTESALLAVLGAALGLLVARSTLTGIIAMVPREDTSFLSDRIDLPTLAFSAAVAIATGLLFGLFPALHSTRPDLVSAIKSTAGQPSGARAASRFRTALATTQIALSTMLLILAGLFTKSLMNISRVDLGIETERLVTFSLSPERNGYTPERSKALFERVEDELAAVPGVSGAAAASCRCSPATTGAAASRCTASLRPGHRHRLDVQRGQSGLLRHGRHAAAGRPRLHPRRHRGRAEGGDRQRGVRAQVQIDRQGGRHAHVVRDRQRRQARHRDRRPGEGRQVQQVKREIPPVYFMLYRQDDDVGGITFYARTRLDEDALLQAIPRLVASLDPNLPVEDLQTMDQQMRQNIGVDRMITILSAAFAILATLLAAIGLYGVLAYTVTQRTREFGLRMALGADAGRVRRLVLGQVGWMTLVGASVGLLAAIGIGMAAGSLLYDLKGYDPRCSRRRRRCWRWSRSRPGSSRRCAPLVSTR